MENFERDIKYQEFKKKTLEPTPFDSVPDESDSDFDSIEQMPVLDKVQYFVYDASTLSHKGIEIAVLIEMAKERSINIDSILRDVEKTFHDFYALGSSKKSFQDMSDASKELFWQLRKKVANDEQSFTEVLERTKKYETSMLSSRDSYLNGGED